MTTVQMNTELWQNIGAIADDELLMRRLARYVRRLAKEKSNLSLMKDVIAAYGHYGNK